MCAMLALELGLRVRFCWPLTGLEEQHRRGQVLLSRRHRSIPDMLGLGRPRYLLSLLLRLEGSAREMATQPGERAGAAAMSLCNAWCTRCLVLQPVRLNPCGTPTVRSPGAMAPVLGAGDAAGDVPAWHRAADR